MYSESDVVSVYNFLKDTPEGPLRNMLVGGKVADGHFRLLMKIARSCPQAQFVECFQGESMPKVKFSPSEQAARDTMWPMIKEKLIALGLLPAALKQAA